MKIHLRQRKQTKKGMISLFLEFYKGYEVSPEGKKKNIKEYKYLDLYLFDKPKNQQEKQHNKEKMLLAEKVKTKYENDLNNGAYGFADVSKQNASFIDYFKLIIEKQVKTLGTEGSWKGALKHLKDFTGGKNLTFNDIDTDFCKEFKYYLENTAKKNTGLPLSSASQATYFAKFKATLHQALKEKIIQNDNSLYISNPKVIEQEREFLTYDEVQALAKTECRYDVLRRAFLFACLTGLRWSDVNLLQWNKMQNVDGNWRYTFNQQKTKGLQYLPISKQAYELCGKQGNPTEKVFIGLKYSAYMNVELSRWILKAGISKQITFHCSRHTFAGLYLKANNNDIYALSKLLGHTEIKTTQVYAKMFNDKLTQDVEKIPNINFNINL